MPDRYASSAPVGVPDPRGAGSPADLAGTAMAGERCPPDADCSHRLAEGVAEATGGCDDRLLITLEEAARRLSVGRTTLYELAARGEIQTVTIGRCRRVPVSALHSFVDERCQAEGSEKRVRNARSNEAP
jgi:excisionase family DNA binding protein